MGIDEEDAGWGEGTGKGGKTRCFHKKETEAGEGDPWPCGCGVPAGPARTRCVGLHWRQNRGAA